MTNPSRAKAQSGYGGRGYLRNGIPGPVRPAISTVLKAESKPQLVQWAVDQTAAYAVSNLDTLRQKSVERGWGFLRYFWNRNVGDPLAGDLDLLDYHSGVLEDASDLGTTVHEWIQAEVTGNMPFPDVSNRNDKFWECVAAWNEFKKDHDFVPHYTEHTVWNEDVAGEEYAGTFDCLWEIDGEMTLLDIKTSRGLYSSTWMQVAALYKAPVLLADGPDGVDLQIRDWQKPVKKLKVLHVRPTDTTWNGKPMEAFAKLVDMPGDVDLHYNAFIGLRRYIESQKALKALGDNPAILLEDIIT